MQNFFAQLTNNRRTHPVKTSGKEIDFSLRMKVNGESVEVLSALGWENEGKLNLEVTLDGQTYLLTKEK